MSIHGEHFLCIEFFVFIGKKYRILGLKVAWDIYRNHDAQLCQAAAIAGIEPGDFLRIARRMEGQERTRFPLQIRELATADEQEIISFLDERQVDLLGRLLEQDVLLPVSCTFTTDLWQDLMLLERLELVAADRKRDFWQYRLTLGRAEREGLEDID